MLIKCPTCGAEIMQSESMKKTIDMFEKMTHEKALPETQAVHYARLAEALLKNGQSDEAIVAYRKAIELTKFPVKRTNFMVQAARILKNNGHDNEAMKLLNEAMAIDPTDRAGASKVRSEISGGPTPA
jgi:tetratricopeptide (TPR) repeat protein